MARPKYRELGDEGLKSRKCCPHNHPNKTPDEVVEKILHLRRTYPMGPIRIVWYLQRYHVIKTSDATVYRVCKRHGMARLPNRVGRRAGDACHRMNVRQRVIMDEPSLPESRTAELMFAPRQPTEISNPIATARARLHIASANFGLLRLGAGFPDTHPAVTRMNTAA